MIKVKQYSLQLLLKLNQQTATNQSMVQICCQVSSELPEFFVNFKIAKTENLIPNGINKELESYIMKNIFKKKIHI